jgi:hypothetical protein
MKTYKLYIPQRYQYDVNDLGCKVVTGTATHEVPVSLAQITRQLGDLINGFTITKGQGYWKGEEKTYVEEVYVIEMIVEGSVHFQDKLNLLVAQWKEDFNQEAMYYQVYESEGILL